MLRCYCVGEIFPGAGSGGEASFWASCTGARLHWYEAAVCACSTSCQFRGRCPRQRCMTGPEPFPEVLVGVWWLARSTRLVQGSQDLPAGAVWCHPEWELLQFLCRQPRVLQRICLGLWTGLDSAAALGSLLLVSRSPDTGAD